VRTDIAIAEDIVEEVGRIARLRPATQRAFPTARCRSLSGIRVKIPRACARRSCRIRRQEIVVVLTHRSGLAKTAHGRRLVHRAEPLRVVNPPPLLNPRRADLAREPSRHSAQKSPPPRFRRHI